ncbi:hypothetical protein Dsin_011476 [Dipteronia sinensis]|uniref:Uncharacterized protein n=1 Tax=Dipteronia sinensis TaxID=43782 RepID=A0AAE0EDM8_9ROSI|nr:hypothetical protein Dsin_011476 [Dipteronia sinensis]
MASGEAVDDDGKWVLMLIKLNVQSCLVLKEIMRIYEKGSGQQVNIQKSNTTFNLNVEIGCKEDILSEVGLVVAMSHDKYLGLPTE